MGVRLYDPTVGRFLSVDPVLGSDTAYDYAGQDPVNQNDLLGTWRHMRISWHWTYVDIRFDKAGTYYLCRWWWVVISAAAGIPFVGIAVAAVATFDWALVDQFRDWGYCVGVAAKYGDPNHPTTYPYKHGFCR